MNTPLVALTMGDPAGIGPEIIVRGWADPALHDAVRALVVGHPGVLSRAAAAVGSKVEIAAIAHPGEARSDPRSIACLQTGSDNALDVPLGQVDARAGRAAFDYLQRAIELALAGEVAAIVTAPLSKAALWKAGLRYPGHTEILAQRCAVPDVAMMLYLPPGPRVAGAAGLGVVHVTLHAPLAQAVTTLSQQSILRTIHLAAEGLAAIKGSPPRVAVCALNPHAGEEGLFGSEEKCLIAPAVENARRAGLDVTGPLPADTLLVKAAGGEFDAVVAMYHDQGHIPLKLLGRYEAVNVTLGLPIVRTSVAHGTAFDIAPQYRAQCGGLLAAVRVAATLARRRDARRPHPALPPRGLGGVP